MTDRIRTFTVVLDRDVRSDDFAATRDAILMIKGVKAVHPQVVTGTDALARTVVASELHAKAHEMITALFDGHEAGGQG